ncbi:MAG: flagellar protein FlaG [Anaerolineaceae bacterium]|jgi:uncharacterized FlaG/YvyC family protein
MKEMNISPVSGVEKKVEQNNIAQSIVESSVERIAEQQSNEAKESQRSEQSSMRGYSLKDVALKFEIDNVTDELTIFVVDKSTKSVLRTIPPEELEKLNAGDLLEIAA